MLTYLPSFEEDAIDIWRHVAADDPVAADRLIEQVWRRCQLLADHPMAGRARPEIAAECRHRSWGRFWCSIAWTATGSIWSG